jgi:hypothetical protein
MKDMEKNIILCYMTQIQELTKKVGVGLGIGLNRIVIKRIVLNRNEVNMYTFGEMLFKGYDGEKIYPPEDLTVHPMFRTWLGNKDVVRIMPYIGQQDCNKNKIFEMDVLFNYENDDELIVFYNSDVSAYCLYSINCNDWELLNDGFMSWIHENIDNVYANTDKYIKAWVECKKTCFKNR